MFIVCTVLIGMVSKFLILKFLSRNSGFMFHADAGVTSNGGNASNSIEGSLLRANIQCEKEESDVEKAISDIIAVQVCHVLAFCLMVLSFLKFDNLC